MVLGVAASACVPSEAASDGQEQQDDSSTTVVQDVPQTTGVPRMRPTSAEDLGIALDETGRPYDNYWGAQGTVVERRLLTRLQIDRGRLELFDGDALGGPVVITIRDTESVNFATAEELNVGLYWQQFPTGSVPAAMQGEVPTKLYPLGTGADGDTKEAIIGVELSVPGSTVARWDAFEPAYESDEGLGAATSRRMLEVTAQDFEFGDFLIEEPLLEQDRAYRLADLDDEPGNETFLFDNGGPARVARQYELTEGFDEDGQLVSVLLWVRRFPWRLAVAEGTPPADIVEREEELIDCIEGRRLIDKWGRCT